MHIHAISINGRVTETTPLCRGGTGGAPSPLPPRPTRQQVARGALPSCPPAREPRRPPTGRSAPPAPHPAPLATAASAHLHRTTSASRAPHTAHTDRSALSDRTGLPTSRDAPGNDGRGQRRGRAPRRPPAALGTPSTEVPATRRAGNPDAATTATPPTAFGRRAHRRSPPPGSTPHHPAFPRWRSATPDRSQRTRSAVLASGDGGRDRQEHLVVQPPAGTIRRPTVPVRPRRRVLRVMRSHPSRP